MAGASTFEELFQVCEKYLPQVITYGLPQTERYITSTPGLTVDTVSLSLLPTSAPERYFPVIIRGDGNCFPQTLSLLLFSSQAFLVEMRVRIVLEMTLNRDLYVNPQFLSLSSHDNGKHLLALLIKYADVPYNEARSASETLKEEIMRIRCLSTECGMWHMCAAANILGRTIHSIFPEKGPAEMQFLAQRQVHPALNQQEHRDAFIMWPTHRNDQAETYWAPTHFVPLLPLHPSSGEEEGEEDICNNAFIDDSSLPDPDEFYLLSWQDKEYVCQVIEFRPEDELVHIAFMTERDELFYWASVADRSWENKHYFMQSSKNVKLVLNERLSSQRKQLYEKK